ncbi:hypothetical protein MACH09_37390 [Vibrio sp. MACH09]|uniref:hypothetical protein n=1 Tax=Vibrio sp. MACH09 TaxID=3025122 RepID=UPI00279272A0|nr:hypothetical protein [Vibrio sp. MACH09]GLO63231.1 hypothetical protein MACH09_37390 [Vibrio sp. MACH09]
MDKKALEAFAKETAKGIKSPEDLTEFSHGNNGDSHLNKQQGINAGFGVVIDEVVDNEKE